jgi:hypothetical protein
MNYELSKFPLLLKLLKEGWPDDELILILIINCLDGVVDSHEERKKAKGKREKRKAVMI